YGVHIRPVEKSLEVGRLDRPTRRHERPDDFLAAGFRHVRKALSPGPADHGQHSLAHAVPDRPFDDPGGGIRERQHGACGTEEVAEGALELLEEEGGAAHADARFSSTSSAETMFTPSPRQRVRRASPAEASIARAASATSDSADGWNLESRPSMA